MMKFALLLLSALVTVSQQQLRQHPSERMFWLASYYAPQSTAINSYYWPASYDNDELDTPFFRQLQGNGPDIEENYAGTKLGKTKLNRYKSPFVQNHTPQNNARFVIRFSTGTPFLNKVKTITFTLTSSVTFTKVQSCIPSAQFSVGYADVVCRRKRAETAEPSITNTTDIQLAMEPFKVQQVETTVISPLHPLVENVELPLISSSKDDDFSTNEMQSPRPIPPLQPARMKRLFFHFVTTTTFVSYSFFTVNNTKTVNLVSLAGQLICRPEDYSLCSATASVSAFPSG